MALVNARNAAAQDIDPPSFTLDFEQGTLLGWEREGRAFANQPTLGDNPKARNQGQSANQQGRYWIGTYENYQGRPGQNRGAVQGNTPTGILTSKTFIIPKGTLSFLVGGSSVFETRVELDILDQIEGRIRVKFASGKGREQMQRVEWDLSPYAGRRGQLRIIDASTVGHINVDDFNFSYFQNNPGSDSLSQPTVVLRVIKSSVKVNQTTRFLAYLSPQYNVASYNFHFGDGKESGWKARPQVSYRYNSPGEYTAFVEVRPNPDLNPVRSNPVLVKVVMPEARLFLSADKTDVFVNEPVRIKGGVDTDSLDLVIYYGDDNSTVFKGPTVEHRYPQPGTYRVQLVAYLGKQVVAEKAITINVRVPDLSLKAGASEAAAGDSILFAAIGIPFGTAVEYKFHFGDGSESGWSVNPATTHSYANTGVYNAFVEARLSSDRLIQSSSVAMRIRNAGGFPNWVFIVFSLLILGAGGYFLATRGAPGTGNGTPPPGNITTTVNPHTDLGKQQVATGSPLRFKNELRLKPVKDIGQQSVETNGNLIKQEQKYYE